MKLSFQFLNIILTDLYFFLFHCIVNPKSSLQFYLQKSEVFFVKCSHQGSKTFPLINFIHIKIYLGKSSLYEN